MVARLLRLKLTLLANSFRGRPAALIGRVLVLLYGMVLVTATAAGFVSLRFETPDIARAVVVVVGSVVVLGFLVLPLSFGADDALDPRRFILFGIPAGRLALGVGAAAFVSVPTLIVAVLAVAQVVTWSRGAVPLLVAMLATTVLVPTCVLAARVASAVASAVLSSRQGRDVTRVTLVAVLAVGAPVAAVLATADWESRVLPVLRRLTSVLGWTPLGAAWSAPADAANGEINEGLTKLAIAAGFLLVLALVWRALVSVLLMRRDRPQTASAYSGLGWFEAMPATPFGAIAARSLSYWGRDARYVLGVAIFPIIPVAIVAPLLVVGVPVDIIAWLPVPALCLFLGWTVHNDLAHDSSAFWTHVSANTRGRDDRWGRIIPPLFIGAPVIGIGSVATVVITGYEDTLPALIGLSLCLLLAGLGVSSVTSAAFPYPAVHPGDSAFAQPQATGSTGSRVQALSLLITVLFSAPVATFIFFAATDPDWYWAALGAGIVIGVGVLLIGVRWGGWIVRRRAPELLAFTLQN